MLDLAHLSTKAVFAYHGLPEVVIFDHHRMFK